MYIFKYMLQQEAGEGEAGTGAVELSEQELSQRLSSAENDEISEEVKDKAEEVKEVDTPKNVDSPSDFKPSSLWDNFKSDEGFILPTDLSPENEKQLLADQAAKKYGIEVPVLHPLAKQIQDMSAKNPNLTINDLVSEMSNEFVDASKMSLEEKISFDLFSQYGKYHETENPSGLTEEDIEEQLKAMTKIQKRELGLVIDKRIDSYNHSLMTEYETKNAETYEKNYNNVLVERDKYIDAIKMKVDKVESIYGIPVSQEDHTNWLAEFKDFITPDKATGIRGIDEMLSDDMTLYKLFVLAAKQGEDKVLELITKGREATKEELFKKLKLTSTFSGTRSMENKNLDFEQEGRLLGMPEVR